MRTGEFRALLIERLAELGTKLVSENSEGFSVNRESASLAFPRDIQLGSMSIVLREPHVTLDDVVLDNENIAAIRGQLSGVLRRHPLLEAVAGLLMRGAGTIFLFYGPPGTGKTMTAEAIARFLGRPYFVVGTAEVESSVPGEMERRLSAIFEYAERTGHVLVLDECDSLLYRRSLVGRIEGAEINHLMRCIESSRCIAVLCTNRVGVLDDALARRMSLKIAFPFPEWRARVRIWGRFLSEKIPHDSALDPHYLAVFPLTGGQIQAIFVAACRKAVGRGLERVEVADLFTELAREYQTMNDSAAGEHSEAGRSGRTTHKV